MKRNVTLAVLVAILLSFIIVWSGTLSNILKGNVHFPENLIGNALTMENGQKYTVFRRLKVNAKDVSPERPVVFKVRFKFKNLGTTANKRLSIIPAPFLIGMKGFQEKVWTINEDTNDFQGIYQWSSKETAERYPESFIFKVMTKRASPGSVSYEIMPDTDLSDYLTTRSEK